VIEYKNLFYSFCLIFQLLATNLVLETNKNNKSPWRPKNYAATYKKTNYIMPEMIKIYKFFSAPKYFEDVLVANNFISI